MTTVAILGAAGRMGRMLVEAAVKHGGLKVAAAVEVDGSRAIGSDAGSYAGLVPLGVAITNAANAAPADVVVDFTFHSAVPGNIANAIAKGAKGYVLGTTGLDEGEKAAVRDAAGKMPVVWASNYSLGVNILTALVESCAAKLGDAYDIEITEMHHRHKKDAPSGTALTLAEAAAKWRGYDLDAVAAYGRHGMSGERPVEQIAIHSLRGGDVVGDHTVVFAGEGERIELTHKASSRSAFAGGAMVAAAWLPGRAPGIYSMRDVLHV